MLREQGHYTLSDLAAAIGMHREEKTMCRILTEIKKVHKDVNEKANRYGRKFLYTYKLASYVAKLQDVQKASE